MADCNLEQSNKRRPFGLYFRSFINLEHVKKIFRMFHRFSKQIARNLFQKFHTVGYKPNGAVSFLWSVFKIFQLFHKTAKQFLYESYFYEKSIYERIFLHYYKQRRKSMSDLGGIVKKFSKIIRVPPYVFFQIFFQKIDKNIRGDPYDFFRIFEK